MIAGTAATHAPDKMLAMLLERPNSALRKQWIPIPETDNEEVLIRVAACGVCRTDLHIVDSELPPHKHPLVLGHEVVGTVVRSGKLVTSLSVGQRVGVPWLGESCGKCRFCRNHRENLCDHARFTGYDNDGGYAQYVVAQADYCIPLPEQYDDVHAAPLLIVRVPAFITQGSGRRSIGNSQVMG